MLPERIGSAQLAEMSAQGESLATTLQRADLPRLSEVVARGPGVHDKPLDAEIGFRRSPEGPVVSMRVRGELQLVCQRCFGPVTWPIELDATLTAVGSEDAAEYLADPFDVILLDEGGALGLRAAVEDEILAVLPLAPVHVDLADCSVPGEPAEEPPARVHRPFAGLGALLGKHGRKDDER